MIIHLQLGFNQVCEFWEDTFYTFAYKIPC